MWSEVEEDMLATLLPFHRRIVEELIREDGLCILSAGMGWQKVVSPNSERLEACRDKLNQSCNEYFFTSKATSDSLACIANPFPLIRSTASLENVSWRVSLPVILYGPLCSSSGPSGDKRQS